MKYIILLKILLAEAAQQAQQTRDKENKDK